VILSQPPKVTEEDDTFQEEQKVQIDFSNSDEEEEPESHRFIIHRDSTGSYELVDRLQRNEEQEEDRVGVGVSLCCVIVRIFQCGLHCSCNYCRCL